MKRTFFSAIALGVLLLGNVNAQQLYTPGGTTGATTNNTGTTTGFVGIGTTAPTQKLTVIGNIYSQGNIESSGSVTSNLFKTSNSVGCTTVLDLNSGCYGAGGTTIKLDQDAFKLTTTRGTINSTINFGGYTSGYTINGYTGANINAQGASPYFTYKGLGLFGGTGGELALGANLTKHVTIKTDGKVTISDPGVTLNTGGALPSSFRLFVQDGIITEKLKVAPKATADWSWPDYVFSKSYKLNSLDSVETFINKNSHLPDVPSAKEIGTNGFDVAEMDAKLLRKVEELTLYVIDMNKKLKEQEQEETTTKEEVAILKKKIEALESENKELKK